MKLTPQFKERIVTALFERRDNYVTTDSKFAAQFGLTAPIYSRLKSGERDRLISEDDWLNMGRLLDVTPIEKKWNAVETAVFKTIKDDVVFCAKNAVCRMYTEEAGIGKSFTAKYLSKTLKNCFYIDASQSINSRQFIRDLAQVLGLNGSGKFADVLANIKYYLITLESPSVLIDECRTELFEYILSLWNGTEDMVSWYLLGGNGFRKQLTQGIGTDKRFFAEIYSRFTEKFTNNVPEGSLQRQEFLVNLITQIIKANVRDQSKVDMLVSKTYIDFKDNKKSNIRYTNPHTSGLRRAKALIKVHNL
jgi:hypothetical protein